MKELTFQEEKKLLRKGCKRVAGLDEVGRGALCGPVVACAVMLKERTFLLRRSVLLKIKDSKKLTAKQREYFYNLLIKHPSIEWGIGRVSEKVIDKINILEATKLAMRKAVEQLDKKPDFLILDGNFKIDSLILQKSIVKADEKVFSCACASIIAKVYRDRIMQRYDKKYPQYGFSQHKGYPTKLHRVMIQKYGFSQIHRKSFKI